MALNTAPDAPLPGANPINLDAVAGESPVFDYDRDSDTLMVHFYGRGRPAVSIEAGDDAYVRLDRAADEIVGLHFENFLRAVVPRHRELLAHADVYGIEPAPGDAPSAAVSPAQRSTALAALGRLLGPVTVRTGSR